MRLPFVGRANEMARLIELHASGKHILVLGPAGVGKTALVREVRERLKLAVSTRSGHLGEICDGLEKEVGLLPEGLKLLQRKHRVREALATTGRTVVFDGVGWAGPQVASFFESVMQRAPVWICARSERPWDMGHFWPLLVRFERVELKPFHPAETQMMVAAAMAAGVAPAETAHIVDWLQRRSGGSPLVLRELLEVLACGHYNLRCRASLRRLDLDRRIREIIPDTSLSHD